MILTSISPLPGISLTGGERGGEKVENKALKPCQSWSVTDMTAVRGHHIHQTYIKTAHRLSALHLQYKKCMIMDLSDRQPLS